MKVVNTFDIKRAHIGVMQSLFQEYELHRLPRLLRLKDKVDRGEVMSDVDFDFLCQEIRDACATKHMTVNYPELVEFCLHMGHLYRELCDQALANEPR